MDMVNKGGKGYPDPTRGWRKHRSNDPN